MPSRRKEQIRVYQKSPRGRYSDHKCRAKRRGIEWNLTFEEWWKVWNDSGHWLERGRGVGKYCMGRKGDIGPYSLDNVNIILNEHNLILGAQTGVIKKIHNLLCSDCVKRVENALY